MVFRVALTGGLASGKSEAARHFKALGAEVIDADEVVQQLYEADAEGTRQVALLFGSEVLASDGSVDRRALGRVVLNDSGAMDRLNRTIHPLVRDRLKSWFESLPEGSVAVVEAALVLETGAYRNYDSVVVVWCEAEDQVSRAVARGMDEERARGLLRAQMPIEEKKLRADWLIDNSGDRGELAAEVARVWSGLLDRARTKSN